MDRIAVFIFGDRRRIHCKDLDAAKARWSRDYPGADDASIGVLFPIGANDVLVTSQQEVSIVLKSVSG